MRAGSTSPPMAPNIRLPAAPRRAYRDRPGKAMARRGAAESALLALLWLAVLAGGGGSPSALWETLVIVGACAIVVAVALLPLADRPIFAPRALVLAAALPLLALAQLVPLPAGWLLPAGQPLRGDAAEVLAAIGAPAAWWPLSLDPPATLWSVLALLPPALAFALATGVGEWRPVMRAVAVLALISAMLGALQFAGGAQFELHPRPVAAGPGGLFANQNSQGDLLVIGICALLALLQDAQGGGTGRGAGRRRDGQFLPVPAMALAIGFLALSVVLTGSRAAMALLLVPLVLHYALLRRAAWSRREIELSAWGPAAILGVLALLAWTVPAIGAALARFDLGWGDRAARIWPDSLALAAAAFPWGTGIGTFAAVFPLFERLDAVDPSFANRAHCEYLEFAIEAGLPGIVLLIAGGGLLARAVLRRLRTGAADLGDMWALATLAVIALHALVDYPLRAMALAVVAALAAGRFFRTDRRGEHGLS